jgi:hypothetical protein
MNLLLTIFDGALSGQFGRRCARWAKRALLLLLVVLAYFLPTHDILWIANAVGQWKIAPYIHVLEQMYHVKTASP